MSDSHRTYRAIKKAILQLYPTKPQGNLARHLTTLVGLVSGIVLSKSCQLPTHRPTAAARRTWADRQQSAGRGASR